MHGASEAQKSAFPYHCGVCTKEAIIRYSLGVTFKWYDNVNSHFMPDSASCPRFSKAPTSATNFGVATPAMDVLIRCLAIV
jgi:hypothetical protein